MARKLNQLKDPEVRKATEPGTYCDGGGLELQVTATGSRNWVMRYMLAGKRRQMGLGGYPTISLADARQKAADARKLLEGGIDPLAARDAARAAAAAAEEAAKVEAAKRRTFRQCAEAYIADHEPAWKNPKLAKLWRSTLATYAYPTIGALPVEAVTVAMVVDILRPIWLEKRETADRVRMRTENVLDWAAAHELRTGENPARLKGRLEHLLPERGAAHRGGHHAALPYSEIATFMAELKGREALAARGLELLVLTAARTSEVLNAEWTEFDLDGAVWTVPGSRMKMGREHRVPLSTRAVDVLRNLHKSRTSEQWVFPGGKAGKPLSNMAFLVLIDRMGRKGVVTAHGLRSSFKDWASETTDYPNEVSDMALAHSIKNAAEAAYRRGDLFEKRVKLMQAWADYCQSKD